MIDTLDLKKHILTVCVAYRPKRNIETCVWNFEGIIGK